MRVERQRVRHHLACWVAALLLGAQFWGSPGVLLAQDSAPDALLVTSPGSGEGTAVTPEDAAAAEPTGVDPIEVFVGVYVNRIVQVDMQTSTFTVDFWIWFRWLGEGIDPVYTFEMSRGQIEPLWSQQYGANQLGSFRTVVDGWNYAAARVQGRVQNFYELARFPLDDHRLTVGIEDGSNPATQLVYIAESELSGIDPNVQVSGWDVSFGGADVTTHTYHTTFGDPSLPKGSVTDYSLFRFHIDLTRPGLGYFWKLFWASFLSTVIALLALLIDPAKVEPRLALGVGALFASVASTFAVTQSLPPTSQITLAETVSVLSVFFIFASIVVHLATHWLTEHERERPAHWLNGLSLATLLAAYLVLNISLF